MTIMDAMNLDAGSPRIDERQACARLEPVVRLYAMRRLRASGDVDDFVQDVLLSLVEAIRDNRIGDAASVGPYAIGICRNLLHDGARTRARRHALMERFASVLEAAAEPATPVVAFERVRIEDCVSRLTSNARAVLKRAMAFDESNEEIAASLGIAAGNVRVIRHRSLKFLRECVDHPISWETVP